MNRTLREKKHLKESVEKDLEFDVRINDPS